MFDAVIIELFLSFYPAEPLPIMLQFSLMKLPVILLALKALDTCVCGWRVMITVQKIIY